MNRPERGSCDHCREPKNNVRKSTVHHKLASESLFTSLSEKKTIQGPGSSYDVYSIHHKVHHPQTSTKSPFSSARKWVFSSQLPPQPCSQQWPPPYTKHRDLFTQISPGPPQSVTSCWAGFEIIPRGTIYTMETGQHWVPLCWMAPACHCIESYKI